MNAKCIRRNIKAQIGEVEPSQTRGGVVPTNLPIASGYRQPSNLWKMVILLRMSESNASQPLCGSTAANWNAMYTLCSSQYQGCFSFPIFTRSAYAEGSSMQHNCPNATPFARR